MGFDHRKLILADLSCNCNPVANKEGLCPLPCLKTCPNVCKKVLEIGDFTIGLPPPILPNPPPPAPPAPPPPPPPPLTDPVYHKPPYNQKHLTESNIILMASLIGASLLLTIVYLTVRSYWRENNNNSRRRGHPVLFDTRENFLDEDHGPVLDHPIWYIHTVGLPQAVIESITVCKYKKDEGLIEGTDCSVCLSEFEEDESLRLLPKCSHAFHIPCIDTWLRSHKNCPLCRAPIVCDIASSVQVSVPEPISSDSGSRDSIQLENLESTGGGVGNHHVGRGASEVGVTDDDSVYAIGIDGRNAENPRKVLPNYIAVGSCDPRALSDLVDSRRVAEQDVQPMRRSVSMDSSSASRIYRAVANVIPEHGSSNSQLVHLKNPNSGIVAKQGSANSSLSKLVRSSSIGLSLQMGSISMKRPFSSSRKLSSSKHGRSLSSILPL